MSRREGVAFFIEDFKKVFILGAAGEAFLYYLIVLIKTKSIYFLVPGIFISALAPFFMYGGGRLVVGAQAVNPFLSERGFKGFCGTMVVLLLLLVFFGVLNDFFFSGFKDPEFYFASTPVGVGMLLGANRAYKRGLEKRRNSPS